MGKSKKTALCKCGGHLKTINTDSPPKYQALVIVQRRRECTTCHKRFTTYEIDRNNWKWILDKEQKLNEREEALAWQINEVKILDIIRRIL